MKKRVAFYTLGCKLNYSETSTFGRMFSENGYDVVPHQSIADLYVINTCSVTEHSDKKCRNAIRKLYKQNQDAIIAVTGCYAQLKSEEILNIEGVDIVLGAQEKGELLLQVSNYSEKHKKRAFCCEVNDINSFFPAYSTGERTRSFLKIQDGCDYYCSYCTVPLARGRSRNAPISQLVKDAGEIAQKGIKEIVLTGVNSGDFGKTTGESFLTLLKELNKVEGIERYRISSIEPNLLTEEIITWIASGTKFLPHFHIPLQSGSDQILLAMGRRYDTALFRKRIEFIRSNMENVFFGIDVIVGFPGETDALFEETYRFLEEIRPAFLHIFPYSKRANTKAALMSGQVSEFKKGERVASLKKLSDRLYEEFYLSNKGREEEVLFESTQKGGKMFGFTRNYLKVELPYKRELIGKIVKIQIP